MYGTSLHIPDSTCSLQPVLTKTSKHKPRQCDAWMLTQVHCIMGGKNDARRNKSDIRFWRHKTTRVFHIHISEINLQKVNGGQDGYHPQSCVSTMEHWGTQKRTFSNRRCHPSTSQILCAYLATREQLQQDQMFRTKVRVLKSGPRCSLFVVRSNLQWPPPVPHSSRFFLWLPDVISISRFFIFLHGKLASLTAKSPCDIHVKFLETSLQTATFVKRISLGKARAAKHQNAIL